MLGNRLQWEMAYSLMFSLPGTPALRYGDEIGMGDDLRLTERSSVRTPMQWSSESQAGFSTSEKTLLPVISNGSYSYETVNVESQRLDINSMLNWTERTIRLRKECPELGWGDYEVLDTGQASVLGIRYDWRNNSLVILHNFHEKPCSIVLEVEGEGGGTLTNLLPGEPESGYAQWKAQDGIGRIRLPLVSGGWLGPHPEAEEILKFLAQNLLMFDTEETNCRSTRC